jgi:hypothetical protein
MLVNRILLPFHAKSASGSEHVVTAAFGLARRFGAEVEGLYPQASLTTALPYATEATPPAMLQELMQRARAVHASLAAQAQAVFEGWAMANLDVTSHFYTTDGITGDVVGSRARLADVTVVARATNDDAQFWHDVREGALFSSGRPALLVPATRNGAALGETIVIGYQDTVEVARAVSEARVYASKAKKVLLVSVGAGEGTRRRMDELKGVLGRTHPDVQTRALPQSSNIARSLIDVAAGESGALLVIGAYSHWRWRERVFGGVTEELLEDNRVPVLMVH